MPSSGCTSASRGGSRSRTSTPRRPTSPRIRKTRRRCSTCSRRSTTASSATSPRRSRPTRASSISTPIELPAIQSLDRLYGQAERWYDLLGNLERQVELSETSGETVALKYRIGHLWQIRLGDVARAIESYREALEMDPSHAETLHALDGLVHGKVEPVMAARVLEPIYETGGEYAKLVDVLEVMVAHNEDPLARVELLHRIAQLHEQMIGNAHAAFDAYARALRDDSGNQLTLGHIERLAEITGTWEPLANLYAAEAGKSLDVPRQVDLYSRLARVYEQELADVAEGDRDAARSSSRSSSTTSRPCSRSIVCTRRRVQWPELTEILRREIQLAESDDEIADLQYRLGHTLENQLGDRKGAVEVVPRDPHGPPDARRRARRPREHVPRRPSPAGDRRRPRAALRGGERVRQAARDPRGAADQARRCRIARRCTSAWPSWPSTSCYDQNKALDWWCAAHRRGSALGAARSRRASGSPVRPVRGTTWSPRTPARSSVRRTRTSAAHDAAAPRARLRVRAPRRRERGRRRTSSVLEIEPKDADALAALDRLYLNAAMYDDLAEILRRRIEVVQDPDEQLELYFRRGAIFSDALGDLEQSLKCYTAVLDQESRNRRALEAIESIHFRREDWKKLFETYEKLIDTADADAEMADIYARMARHLLGRAQRRGHGDRAARSRARHPW